MPDFYARHELEHRQHFQKLVDRKDFCNVNVEDMQLDVEWLEFVNKTWSSLNAKGKRFLEKRPEIS